MSREEQSTTSGSDANPAIAAFVQRWQNASGNERANYQLFLTELSELLGLERPDPASHDTEENAYVFERKVVFHNPDGSRSHGFIDLYKRGCFVCEAKQTGKALDSSAWDNAMIRAHGQAQQYARALPAAEGRPPFILVVDVGRNIELYAEFSRTGAAYVPFPDPRSHRIRLDDLQREDIRAILRAIWNDPLSLDPARRSARVTREIADHLARLAKSLEGAGHAADTVAGFLMRALFTMFAEDVGLLEQRSFTGLLQKYREHPDNLPHVLRQVWTEMNQGSAFSIALEQRILRFNGGLFADPAALPLDKQQIDLLIEAARADWRHVEPAIFGTLLERALDPHERHRLGAHYTPRAYVERLVMPTVIEPLRDDWATVQATALQLDREGKRPKAIAAVQQFHHDLCHIRVLDPACGSGNFLYVTLEHLKRLEGEVLNTLDALGETQGRLEMAGITVDPHQMLGLETNPRAARIAEAVLWIGYLQWHFRTRGKVNPPEPVLKDFHNIENRDAVLAWDSIEYERDEQGKVRSRWDGRTFKTHPVTGEQVPDEAAQVPIEKYINPRKAGWPVADFIVGNPPFIGTARMRSALGDGYAEALRKTYPKVPESADYVMYWWHHAAGLVREGEAQRFGFITTNSLRQTFNRRVIAFHMAQKKPLSLAYAVPDHPWVDSSDGAAVRIAMTVGVPGEQLGVLDTVANEGAANGEGYDVALTRRSGLLHANLKTGANVTSAVALVANGEISSPGVKLHGSGFIVTTAEAKALGLGRIEGLERHIREYRNGKDITQTPRGVLVIDLFGLEPEQVRELYPEVYQWVSQRVKPERKAKGQTKDGAGYAKYWWLFGKPRQELRKTLSGLARYIATTETSKHRFFSFLDETILPDNMLVNIALDDAFALGVLSSSIHVTWALAAGGTLEDRPRYNKTRCFETFPFPDLTPAGVGRTTGVGVSAPRSTAQRTTADGADSDPSMAPASARPTAVEGADANPLVKRIRELAEQIDAHRKRQQALHPGLTLTGMYNVLEKLRLQRAAAAIPTPALPTRGEGADVSPDSAKTAPPPRVGEAGRGSLELTPKEKTIHEQGLVSVLAELHDELDRAVFEAYGWSDLAPKLVGQPGGTTPYPDKPEAQAEAEEALLERLVALNAERAAEEARGLVRWLRPEFQNPGGESTAQGEIAATGATEVVATAAKKHPWPKTLPEQVQALRRVLAEQAAPLSAEQIARLFSRAQRKKVDELLQTLADLGQVRREDQLYSL